jgi:DNA-binding Xre family transcriptional regulator
MQQIQLKVKEVAEAKQITRAKLSRLADVSPGTLEKIWKQPYHAVYLHTLVSIAQALDVPITDLYVVEAF